MEREISGEEPFDESLTSLVRSLGDVQRGPLPEKLPDPS